jgi:hypothetical protein
MLSVHLNLQAARHAIAVTVLALILVTTSRGALARCAEAVHSEGQTLPELQALAPDVWWVSAQRGDADAANRGQVANLLIVKQAPAKAQRAPRVWLVGSGPSPMWAQRLRCQISMVVGAPVTDVISPWARPELVLGAKAFHARHWAHKDVARAMRSDCVRCISRLAQRLGDAAADLGTQPVDLPAKLLHGDRGRLGPFEWRRVKRSRTTAVTLWLLPQHGLLTAHGLVWAGGVPDVRDTRADALSEGLIALQRVALRTQGLSALLGEQGPPVGVAEVEQHLAYLNALQAQVRSGQADGSDGVSTPATLPGLATSEVHRLKDPTHALNWQRVWRQAEER